MSIRANKYPGTCPVCDGRVAANAGYLLRNADGAWRPVHIACHDGGKVVTYYSPVTGFSGTRNVRGRCEDAPCCGCCTF